MPAAPSFSEWAPLDVASTSTMIRSGAARAFQAFSRAPRASGAHRVQQRGV